MSNSLAKHIHLWGAFLGGVVFFLIYGWEILNPTFLEWSMKGDAPTHFLGWHFFRYEPWGSPLGMIHSYLYPQGTSLVYTDSIPIMALAFKAISPVLPPIFQYHGLWLLLCYVLQGLFAVNLIKGKAENPFLVLLGTIFFLLSPVIVQRSYGQESLSGHWLILAALFFYFCDVSRWRGINWLTLLVVSVLVHFYFFIMVLGIFCAWIVKQLMVNGKQVLSPILQLSAISMVFVLLTMWQVGYFIKYPDVSSGFGYGEFSMNLLAPLNPFENFFFLKPLYNSSNMGQRHEGFNYLGVGVFVLLLFACYELRRSRDSILMSCRKHAPIICIMTFFFLLAVSNKVTWAEAVLFEINLPEFLIKLLNIIRSSGRMFWPVSYVLIFFAVAVILKECSLKKSFAIFVLCIFLQVVDFFPWYRDIGIEEPTWSNKVQSKEWESVLEPVDHIAFVPVDRSGDDYISFGILAAIKRKTLNVGYNARVTSPARKLYRLSFEESFVSGKLQRDTLYVVNDRKFLKQSLIPHFESLKIDGFHIIAPASNND